MDARNTLLFTGKLNHCAVFTASGFHVPVSAQRLKHRPFNPTGLCLERLKLPRLIRRAIWRFFLFDVLLLRFMQFLCNLSGDLSLCRWCQVPAQPHSAARHHDAYRRAK